MTAVEMIVGVQEATVTPTGASGGNGPDRIHKITLGGSRGPFDWYDRFGSSRHGYMSQTIELSFGYNTELQADPNAEVGVPPIEFEINKPYRITIEEVTP